MFFSWFWPHLVMPSIVLTKVIGSRGRELSKTVTPCLYYVLLLPCKPLNASEVQGSRGTPEEQKSPTVFILTYVTLSVKTFPTMSSLSSDDKVYFHVAPRQGRSRWTFSDPLSWIKWVKHYFRVAKCVQKYWWLLYTQSFFPILTSLDPI